MSNVLPQSCSCWKEKQKSWIQGIQGYVHFLKTQQASEGQKGEFVVSLRCEQNEMMLAELCKWLKLQVVFLYSQYTALTDSQSSCKNAVTSGQSRRQSCRAVCSSLILKYLELVSCWDKEKPNVCPLLQLRSWGLWWSWRGSNVTLISLRLFILSCFTVVHSFIFLNMATKKIHNKPVKDLTHQS